MDRQQTVTLFMIAILTIGVFSAIGISSIPLQKASAQSLTVETSADGHDMKFFGESTVQVVITDPDADDDDTFEDITVNIDGAPETGASGTNTFTIDETSEGSGKFELYLMHVDANEVTAAEIDPINIEGAAEFPVSGTEAPIIRFGPAAAGADLVVEGAEDVFEDVSFDITIGDEAITIDYEESSGELELDRAVYGSTSHIHMFIIDQDANLDPTSPDSFSVTAAEFNDDLFTIVGAGTDDAITFEETGDNTARFEGIMQLTAVFTVADDELRFTAESVQLSLNDRTEYADVTSGNNTSTDTDGVVFEIDDSDGEIAEIGMVTFGTELGITIMDNDQNLDSENADSIDNGLEVFVDIPEGDVESVNLEETDDNSGVFQPDTANNVVRITFVNSPDEIVPANGILELAPDHIDEDMVVTYTDPLSDDSEPAAIEVTTQMTIVVGTVNLPPSSGIAAPFILTLLEADLNDNSQIEDSYSLKLDGTGPFPFIRGGQSIGNIATFDIEIEGDELDFDTPLTYVLKENPLNPGEFVAELKMADILSSTGLADSVDDGDKFEVEYHDLMGGVSRDSSDEMTIKIGGGNGDGQTCLNAVPTIIGTEGNDILVGTSGDDVIIGLGGNDMITGFDGNDKICGGDGDDRLAGVDGNDMISGGKGNDRLFGGKGNDTLFGDAGNDRFFGGSGNDNLEGGEGDDSLFAQEGDDYLIGGPGVDRLDGARTEAGADQEHDVCLQGEKNFDCG